MAVQQLADGVWRVPLGRLDLLNAFLVAGDDGSLVLVDAGVKGSHRAVLGALGELGRAPGDLTHLLLSHAHVDHTGGAARVQRETDAQVRTHEREAVYVREGRSPAYDASSLGGRLMARLPGRATGFARLDVDEVFADGDLLPVGGGVQVVHTPGHTPGHCSFLLPSRGVLLTSDAVVNVRGLRWPPAMLCTDHRLSLESGARLGELAYDVAGFTHGSPVTRDARAAVRALVDGRAS